MYTALYRAYRPEVFDQLLGQEHIAKILKNQIAMGTTSHAYLFCGTRGTGKTTTARLLAKGLNCLSDGERPCGECAACQAIRDGNFLDVVEIDAASNTGVDNIRDLRDSVNYPPVEGRHKVYIIDEVHMLSIGAFNALLKTLEEPPEHVTFILATTEPRKLPATILSRCLRLDFKRIPESVLIEGMKRICREIGIEVTQPALQIIAANADGSVRDGLSILDQCISGGEKVVDAPQVLDFLGASGEEVFIRLTDLVSKRRTAEAIECLASVLEPDDDKVHPGSPERHQPFGGEHRPGAGAELSHGPGRHQPGHHGTVKNGGRSPVVHTAEDSAGSLHRKSLPGRRRAPGPGSTEGCSVSNETGDGSSFRP